ncbi:MAG TPA: hypothetical protein VF179_05625, partial [Thermoanaerobaculia bacterium]|nr:hypothetical protein [Thermoanaerobaculia bacterium]
GPATSHAALYRCFDMWTLDHFVSTDPYCATRTNEGLLGYIATSQLSGTVPLYQTHDPQNDNRFYTISASERQTVLNWGWYDEGIAGYVYLQP